MKKGNLLGYVFLIIAVCFVLAPILWAVATSFKVEAKAITYPPTFLPKPFTLENYKNVLSTNAPRFFLNSFILATATTILTIIASLLAGYSTSRFNFKGKKQILFFILAMGFVPGITILVPMYLLSHQLGLYDTYFMPILVYCGWGVPTATWLMKGFIGNISPAIEEAAYIDGCGKWGTLFRIIIPNIVLGTVATALVVFLYVWNDFIVNAALVSAGDMRNIQMGLQSYLLDTGISWGRFMAYTTLSILPPIILYLVLHEQFIKGFQSQSLK